MFIGDMTPFIIAKPPMKGVSPMAFMFVGSLMNIALLCIGSPMNMNRQTYSEFFYIMPVLATSLSHPESSKPFINH
jgi:hypothetical protein